jgi:Uma2 family endonuclease
MTDAQLTLESGESVTVAPFYAPLYRMTVEQYHEMIAAGILTENDPVELLEGYLVTKMPTNPRHRFTTQTLREYLAKLLPEGYFVDDQEPITTLDSEPEPDGAVVRGVRKDYLSRHPYPQDIPLIIEVLDSTVRQDRIVKQRIYAAGSIPTYWLINLTTETLEAYTEPTGTGIEAKYVQRTDYTRDQLVPLTLDGQMVTAFKLADVLPPSE